MADVVKEETHGKFSYTLFILINSVLGAWIFLALWLILKPSLWYIQWHSPWWKFAVAFVSMSLFNCFVEYFFHRYVLHKPVVRFLSRFYKAHHVIHHSLTRIGKRTTPAGKEIPCIEEIQNIYPITEPEQYEASFFPWYSFIVFTLVITPLLTLLTFLSPSFPWFSGGILAVITSLTLYEFVHAVEHWPKERWDILIEHKLWGTLARKAYSFHLRHHAVIKCNEGISGFFTIPIADIVFKTFVLPKTLYLDGGEWEERHFREPVPCAPIRWLDKKTQDMIEKRRRRSKVKRYLT